KVPKGMVDLPTPKAPRGIVDLPTPKTALGVPEAPSAIPKLPARPPAGVVDLPAPKEIVDLPTPKLGGSSDLPAPKGFFDDLAQPSAQPHTADVDLQAPSTAGDLDLASDLGHPIELDSGPALELGGPSAASGGDRYGDLDLQEPTAKGAIKIGTPK